MVKKNPQKKTWDFKKKILKKFGNKKYFIYLCTVFIRQNINRRKHTASIKRAFV